VVIIDEVSKATPPELLMAMMLARTIILAGDHRQLPPTFREREGSWEEAVDQQEEEGDPATELTRENFEKHRALVTASVFKEYFEKALDTLKASLFIQYRMHPDIMRLINHFYEYRLRCGLEDPDGRIPGSDPTSHRRHELTLRGPNGQAYVTPDRHAIWIDSSSDPAGKNHAERQSGTSKVNDLEAILIAKVLADIDDECARMGYTEEKPKEVAVISFYGQQVQHIREAIRRHQERQGRRFRAIRYDVNTVDRFQGREAAVVLVSLVRNKRVTSNSPKAFVAQFERINVAFSRARELLIIFGARAMFHRYPVTIPNLERPGSTQRPIYRAILDDLLRLGCLWDASRVLAVDAYRSLLASAPPNTD